MTRQAFGGPEALLVLDLDWCITEKHRNVDVRETIESGTHSLGNTAERRGGKPAFFFQLRQDVVRGHDGLLPPDCAKQGRPAMLERATGGRDSHDAGDRRVDTQREHFPGLENKVVLLLKARH